MGNRELKFRVWCPLLKRFALDTEDGYIYQEDNFVKGEFRVGCDNEQVIQQYTGVKDKNGREIYEGDIISCDEYLGDSLKNGHHEKALVIFKDGAFWYSLDGGNNPHQLLMYGANLKIIGNIFENPELL